MLIPEKDEFLCFEVTSDLLALAAKFTISIASLISNDPITAYRLQKYVWTETKRAMEQSEDPSKWIQALHYRSANLLVLSGLHSLRAIYHSKPHGYLNQIKEYLDVIQDIDPNNYDAHLLRGIQLFLSGEIDQAKKEIRSAKNDRNSARQFSLAFLSAYEGQLEQAHKTYKRALKGLFSPETPLDVEIFINDVLQREPDKIQLWYCLGMVNYFVKRDFESARRDFSTFPKKATKNDLFPTSVRFAEQYLHEIEEALARR